MRYVLRVGSCAAALAIAAAFVPGIHVAGASDASKASTLLLVAVIFALVNSVLKPVIKKVGCALYVLTLGLAALVVNGLLLWFTSNIADRLQLPFHVTGFAPAVEGALIVSVVTWLLQLMLGKPAKSSGSSGTSQSDGGGYDSGGGYDVADAHGHDSHSDHGY